MEKRELIRGYATAILQIAEAEGALERVSDELFRFAKAVEQSSELRSSLTDIAIPRERKFAVVEDLLGDRASPQTLNILEFVVSQGRARELSEIVASLAELASEARDKVMAEVRTAVELDDETKQKLADALGKATGKRVEVKVFVDPAVVGGIYAKVGDQVIDATVRRRLQELREQLARTKE
ncbi:MAG TPA: ATP synthase F1 subunit delta [Actinomycetota bacterium]|jgi:F-type H+-transporting ATPase subunit delta|nr:ATP synthase F1 subunit delta [Actinomycetota bacterium]